MPMRPRDFRPSLPSQLPRLVRGLALTGLVLLCACASERGFGEDFARLEPLPEASAPLGGDALIQMKLDLRRAHRDMAHYVATLESLQHRRDSNGLALFGQFLDAYMGLYLDPLLRAEWQSRHPELMSLDADLRLLWADALIRIRERGRAQKVIDTTAARFAGREDMLVDYPVGAQSTLGEALEALGEGKWRLPKG